MKERENNKIKVLHIFAQMPIGGVGTYIKNVWSMIDHKKYHFSCVICDNKHDGEFARNMLENGANVFYAPRISPFRVFKIRKWYKNFFSNNEYDIVELHAPNMAFLCADIAKRYGKSTTIIHFHSSRYSYNRIKAFRNYLLEKPINIWGDYFIACGELVKKKMLDNRDIPANKIAVIHNGIITKTKTDSTSVKEILKKFSLNGEKICIALGNCVYAKNYDFLLDVFKELNKKEEAINLLILGEGNLKNRLITRCRNEKIENIFFLGHKDNVSDYFCAASLLVLPSLFEGLPMAPIEGQLYGLPMLISDRVTSEIKINDNVFFLPLEKGCELWANKIIEVSKLEKCCGNRLIDSDYNVTKTIKKISDLYESII